MKRAITKQTELKKGFPKKISKKLGNKYNINQVFKEAYRVFDSQKDLEKFLERPENMWDSYKCAVFGVNKMKDLTNLQKTSFEFYLCGWLQYYDQVTRNNRIDHTIYFKWLDDEVKIYIYPKPITKGKETGLSGNPTSDPQSPKSPPPPNP